MKSTDVTGDEEFLSHSVQGVFASWKTHRSALANYIADAKNSPEPRERLFADLTPWIASQIKRYRNMWDGSTQIKGEDLSQTFQLFLWESIVEWDHERPNSPTFESNPTGVVIRKTQAKIRRWYMNERRRYWIGRALIQDYYDEPMSLGEYISGWRKEAEEAPSSRERRYADDVVRILSTIGDEFVRGQQPSQRLLARELRQRINEQDQQRFQVALRCGVLSESDLELLVSKQLPALDPRTHSSLRQRKHRARQRYEKWMCSDDGRNILESEGLLPKVEHLWLLVDSMANRRIPKEVVDTLEQEIRSRPGGEEAYQRLKHEGLLDADWAIFDDGPDGCFVWNELGFPEEFEDE